MGCLWSPPGVPARPHIHSLFDGFQASSLTALSLGFLSCKPILTCASHCPPRGENGFLGGEKKSTPFMYKAQTPIQYRNRCILLG